MKARRQLQAVDQTEQGPLTAHTESDKLSDMKVTAREFQKEFGKVADRLKSGERIEVTRRGKVLGFFQKGEIKKVVTPDFFAAVQKHTYSLEDGDQLLRDFNATLS